MAWPVVVLRRGPSGHRSGGADDRLAAGEVGRGDRLAASAGFVQHWSVLCEL